MEQIKSKVILNTNSPSVFDSGTIVDSSGTVYEVNDRRLITSYPTANMVMQNDNVSKNVSIKIERYYDGIDLSTKEINVAFSNAYKEEGLNYVRSEHLEVFGDYIVVNWWVSGNITSAPGKVEFQLRFHSTGDQTYIWQTVISSFEVGRSITTDTPAAVNYYAQERNFEINNRAAQTWTSIVDYDLPVSIEDRTISSVPSDLVLTGDTNSQLLSFSMPRFIDKVDISKKVISIKYVNANNQSDRTAAINIIVNENTIQFGWLINSRFTYYTGIGMFAIEILGYNFPNSQDLPSSIRPEDVEFFYVWQTKPVKITIGPSLYIDGSIEYPGPEWESHWQVESAKNLAETQAFRNEAESFKNTASTKANEASSSASLASSKASAAASSASQAATSASTASDKASQVSTSASQAAESASAAANSANEASMSASQASMSASEASMSASDAAESASSFQGIEDSVRNMMDTIEGYKNTASTKANEASSSASTASTKASQASASATASAASAQLASDKASQASTSASTATTKASEASFSANQAATSEGNAAVSASSAYGYADEASESASDAEDSANLAFLYRNEVDGMRNDVYTQKEHVTTKANEAAESAIEAAQSAATAAESLSNIGDSEAQAAASANEAREYRDQAENYKNLATGTAGGDLEGMFPEPSVKNDSHNHSASTLSGVLPITGGTINGDLMVNGGLKSYLGLCMDFNTATKAGRYSYSDGALNAPAAGWGTVEVVISSNIMTHNNESTWCFQTATTTSGNTWKRRIINDGDWTPWQRVITTNESGTDSVVIGGDYYAQGSKRVYHEGFKPNQLQTYGRKTADTGTTIGEPKGLSMVESYQNGYPYSYGNVLRMIGSNFSASGSELFCGWSGNSSAGAGGGKSYYAPLYYRNKRDNSNAEWSDWYELITSNGGTIEGDLTLYKETPAINFSSFDKTQTAQLVYQIGDSEILGESGAALQLKATGTARVDLEVDRDVYADGQKLVKTNDSRLSDTRRSNGNIAVIDNRNDRPTPNGMPGNTIQTFFKENYPVPSWNSGFTARGWGDANYSAWEISGQAGTNLTNTGLWYRNGSGSTWNPWERILTSKHAEVDSSIKIGDFSLQYNEETQSLDFVFEE